MDKIRELLKKYTPGWAWKYFIIIIVCQMLTYYMPMLLKISTTTTLSSALDDRIPVISAFIYPYVGAYFLWVAGFAYTISSSEYMARRFTAADIMCKAVCITVFIVYPCTLVQPGLDELHGIGAWLHRLIYISDQPINLLPSMHCYMSHLVVRPLLAGYFHDEIKRPMRIALYIFVVLIYMSTLFTKQHVFVDVVTGVALAEVMWHLSGVIVKKR